MSWREPVVLWSLLSCPLLVALAWFAKKRQTSRVDSATNPRTVNTLIVHGESRASRWKHAVFVLSLAALVTALAGPLYGSRTELLHRRGVYVVIALDFSKSMLARDVQPDRIKRAKAELARLLDELDGDRVGLVAFAGDTIEFPMTMDTAALQLFLRDIDPQDMPVGGTAIGRALTASERLLERSVPHESDENDPPSQAVILITDGEDHEGDPVEVAEEMAKKGIVVHTVAIGSRTGEPIPTYAPDGTWTGYQKDADGNVITTSLTAENEKTLQSIAKATGGSYHRAERGTIGIAAISDTLSKMKQQEQTARRVTVHEDRYALVLLISFLLAVLYGILPDAIGTKRTNES
ncbi:MAG: VWA domain-containing protein [Polyangiales bacterium]